jgi:hypothetical protein
MLSLQSSIHSTSTPRKPGVSGTPLKKDYTPRAASQFKSPFKRTVSGTSSAPTAAFSSTRLTPAVQSLEAKVQLLKRAVKIKDAEESGTQKPLEELVVKWRTAGREIAQEVWNIVKDTKTNDDAWSSNQRGMQSGWAWDEGAGEDGLQKGVEMGIDETEEQEKPEDNIGTMLRQLRIDPATLGWDDEEGDFVV